MIQYENLNITKWLLIMTDVLKMSVCDLVINHFSAGKTVVHENNVLLTNKQKSLIPMDLKFALICLLVETVPHL